MQGAPFLVGNERVHVSNVSPDGQPIFGLLPCLQPTLSTSQPGGSQASLANLDSLVLIPEHSLLYAVWRATLAGDLDEVSDIRIEYAELPAAPLTEPAARLGGSVRR